MSDFFHEKGSLAVSIGEGWLSSFEAASLKPGDVVRTSKLAGYPAILLYNGAPLAPCEIVVIGDQSGSWFGARIVRQGLAHPAAAGPGSADDVTELLPTALLIGSIRVSLDELSGAGANTIVNLANPFSMDEDVQLIVGGTPLARGKVVVIEEELGVRVTTVRERGVGQQTVRASGFVLEPSSLARVKDYDFRRPDKFSRIAINRIHDLHCLFLRNLAARLPQLPPALSGKPYPDLVDQCTYGEALAEMRKVGEFSCLAAENSWWRRSPPGPASAARQALPAKVLVEEAGTQRPVPAEARESIERFAREYDRFSWSPILLYYRPTGALADVLSDQGSRDALLACLRGGWKTVADVGIAALARDAERAADIPENEMVVVVSFHGRDDRLGLMILYPFVTLEPLLAVLG